jgi:ankyrin repeat protein
MVIMAIKVKLELIRSILGRVIYISIIALAVMRICPCQYEVLGQKMNDVILEEDTSYGFPVKQISFVRKDRFEIRKIFLLIDDAYFNKENLEKIFVGLSIKYPSPIFLTITAFSDEMKLRQEYADEIKLNWNNRDSSPIGFFRAYYTRLYNEYFDYTPNKDKNDIIRIKLKPSISLQSPPFQEEDTIYSQLLPLIMDDDLTRFNQLLFDVSNVNIKDDVGNTLLMWAARWGKKDIVEILIKKGTDLEAQDVSGNNALMLASYGGHTETVKVLIKYGAKVNVVDKRGESALIGAAKHNQPAVLQVLLKARADINVKNNKGATALMLASDNSLIIEKLLKAGIDKEAKDNDGWTALFYAVQKGYVNKLESLLKASVNVNVKDDDGITPLALAEQYRNSPNTSKIIALLKQAGAK